MSRYIIAYFLFVLTACAAPPVMPLTLHLMQFSDLPNWQQNDHEAALEAFRQSCRKAPLAPTKIADIIIPAQAWSAACRQAETATEADVFFAKCFTPYRALSYGKEDTGLITGYYEPLLTGSLTRTEKYRFPVWGLPSDWHPDRPYLTRRQIEAQGLWGKAKPLLYVEDKIDLFFMHIQGSGRVKLPDGRIMKLAYAGKNQHPYTAIGKYLIERGEVPASEISVPRLKKWLHAHPQLAQETLWKNDSYVFFRFGDQSQGAVGAQGVPLTPEASIAVDPATMPYGLPVYLDTTLPYSSESYTKLVVAQDTGSAIKGPLRADLFFGPGQRAEHLAGGMKQSGKFFVLLPKKL